MERYTSLFYSGSCRDPCSTVSIVLISPAAVAAVRRWAEKHVTWSESKLGRNATAEGSTKEPN